MAKLILFSMVTPEGYFEDSDGALSWHHADAEFMRFSIHQLDQCGALLFGRKTYEMMQAYWTTSEAMRQNPETAVMMQDKTKWVVAKTDALPQWKNTTFIREDLAETILQLKRDTVKDILIFGSANLAFTFRELGLIDEYRIMVNPILLGNGKPLFKNACESISLELVATETFQSGNVLLCYKPKSAPKYLRL